MHDLYVYEIPVGMGCGIRVTVQAFAPFVVYVLRILFYSSQLMDE